MKVLLCEGPDGKEVLYKADTVICAVGYRALTSVVDRLRGTAPEFYYIGDCARPRKVFDAYETGLDTAGRWYRSYLKVILALFNPASRE